MSCACRAAKLSCGVDRTDGASNKYSYSDIRNTAASIGGVRIFSYTLGGGADTSVPKEIACQNGGIFQHVPDGVRLESAFIVTLSMLRRELTVRAADRATWPERWLDIIAFLPPAYPSRADALHAGSTVRGK